MKDTFKYITEDYIKAREYLISIDYESMEVLDGMDGWSLTQLANDVITRLNKDKV